MANKQMPSLVHLFKRVGPSPIWDKAVAVHYRPYFEKRKCFKLHVFGISSLHHRKLKQWMRMSINGLSEEDSFLGSPAEDGQMLSERQVGQMLVGPQDLAWNGQHGPMVLMRTHSLHVSSISIILPHDQSKNRVFGQWTPQPSKEQIKVQAVFESFHDSAHHSPCIYMKL